MKKITKHNLEIPPHREDLISLIVEKSRHLPQRQNVNLIAFCFQRSTRLFPAFLILISAFFVGMTFSTKFSEQKNYDQLSVIEEIYNSNSQIL